MEFRFENALKYVVFITILAGEILGCSRKHPTHDKIKPPSPVAQVDEICASLKQPVLTSLGLDESKNQFFDYAQTKVRDLIPEPVEVLIDEGSFLNRGGAQHVNFHFALSGIPLCQFQARVHSLDGRTYIEGNLPDSLSIGDIPEPMQRDANDMERVLSRLNIKGTAEETTEKACLIWDGSELESALEVEFKVRALPYYALLTKEKVLRAESRFFDAANTTTAQKKIYVKSPKDSTNLVLTTITLPGMSAGGSLCSQRFQTIVPSIVKKAFSTQSQFFFAPTDSRFKETSLFTNASLHSDWFLSLGILTAWPGPKLNIVMDGSQNFLNNSSVYLSASGNKSPTIKIGAGDGTNLQNLFVDFDVVSHELGHHVLFQTLTSTDGESLVIHEGLADFFVYGNTGYPCLGNLICPAASKLCYSAQCLRTGLYPLNFGDPHIPSEPHKVSQILSSMLWDIGNGNSSRGIPAIGLDLISKITLKAVDFFPPNAQYADLIRSLLKADQALNRSANCSTIKQAAEGRGLKDVLASANVSC